MSRKCKVLDDLEEYEAARLKDFQETNGIRYREIVEDSIRRGFLDVKEGRVYTLQELKIRLGDAPPLVGVLAHPCNVRKP